MKRGIIVALFLLLVIAVIFFSQDRSSGPLQIGIIQIVEHPALDAARQGFIDALSEAGFEEGVHVVYQLQNAQGDMAVATTIARKFVDDKVDLVLAIATPTSQAMAQATEEIPILITAVTDPLEAGLVLSMEKPGTNVTGTTDMTPVRTQLELLKELSPEARRVGIIYNTGEINSVVQAQIAKEAAPGLGLEVVEAVASNSGEVMQSARSLVGRVDALYVPTCNTVVSALEAVVIVAEENNLPLIVGEENSVERGGLATTGINYYDLGFQTGKMAIEVIEGAEPSEMAIQSADKVETVVNLTAALNMGVEIPDSLLQRAHRILERE